MDNRQFKILINESSLISSSYCGELLKKLDMDVTICSLSGSRLLDKLYKQDYDVVITDIFIAEYDAIKLKQMYCANRSYPTKFIGLLHANNPYIEKAIINADFSYYFIKPLDERSVCITICEQLSNHFYRCCSNMNKEQVVKTMLRNLNVSAELIGYVYMCESILIYANTQEASISITKVIYPIIAKRFKTTCCCVEKTMRLSIDIAWKAGNMEYQKKYFGYSRNDNEQKRPTNLKFIATMANNLLQYEKEQERFLDIGYR